MGFAPKPPKINPQTQLQEVNSSAKKSKNKNKPDFNTASTRLAKTTPQGGKQLAGPPY
jgi:hypothetical protein